ncbi:MAG: Modification methylase HemK [Pseudomonadota bacterium]
MVQPPTDPSNLPAELITIRDWFRYAVTQFERAGLVYGHGTTSAVDEAAFLVLETLRLPINDINPWLDARLVRQERAALAQIIEARVVTRKPASYLTKTAYLGPYKFHVDERVIVPRSFIAELILADGLASVVPEPESVSSVLELCTGSASIAIVAAHAFADAHVDATELSADALNVAQLNIKAHGLSDRISAHLGDLYGALPPKPYDLIITNPPYVTDAAVGAFPPEYRAEPKMAHAGGKDGLDLVHRILKAAPDYLAPEGVLVCEIGQARPAFEAAYPGLEVLWLATDESEDEVFAVTREALTGRRKSPKKARK